MGSLKDIQVSEKDYVTFLNESNVMQFIWDNLDELTIGILPLYSFHNLKHYINVAIISLYLANFYLPNDYSKLKILCDASLLHDIGRVDDIYDFNHGYVGTIIASDILKNEEYYQEDDKLNLVKTLILGHNMSPFDLSIYQQYNIKDNDSILLLKILRDADILERIRSFGFKLNPDELCLYKSSMLINFVKYLNDYNIGDKVLEIGDSYDRKIS